MKSPHKSLKTLLLGAAAISLTAGMAVAQQQSFGSPVYIGPADGQGNNTVINNGGDTTNEVDELQGDNLGDHVAIKNIDANGYRIFGLGLPELPSDAVNKEYVDSLAFGGGGPTGDTTGGSTGGGSVGDDLGSHVATQTLDMNNNRIIRTISPIAGTDVANKDYVDGAIQDAISGGSFSTGGASDGTATAGEGDNLGNHEAERNLDMTDNQIVNLNQLNFSRGLTVFDSGGTVTYDAVGSGSRNHRFSIDGFPSATISEDGIFTGVVGANRIFSSAHGGGLDFDPSAARALVLNKNNSFATLDITNGAGHGVHAVSRSSGHTALAAINDSGGDAIRCSTSKSDGCNGNQAWANFSDGRIKTDVTPLDRARGLEAIRQLRPVSYKWSDDGHDKDENRVGFIAQEVEKIFPEFVGMTSQDATITNGDEVTVVKNVKVMSYAEMVAPLTLAVQQLADENEILKQEIVRLKESHEHMGLHLAGLMRGSKPSHGNYDGHKGAKHKHDSREKLHKH